MLERMKNFLNKEEKSPREEYEDKSEEVKTLKEEADDSEDSIESSQKINRDSENAKISLDSSLEYMPSDAEERYRKAKEELDKMKNENEENAEDLNNQYDSLLEERNALLAKIENVEGDRKDELVSRLGQKNKEIREFERTSLNVE